jgi:predicted RNA binding protein YcfA (HicA-like mRNA interferase family)
MKRRRLLQHLQKHGCTVLREGGAHTLVVNPANGRRTSLPRHREIDTNTARAICEQLDVPAPPER